MHRAKRAMEVIAKWNLIMAIVNSKLAVFALIWEPLFYSLALYICNSIVKTINYWYVLKVVMCVAYILLLLWTRGVLNWGGGWPIGRFFYGINEWRSHSFLVYLGTSNIFSSSLFNYAFCEPQLKGTNFITLLHSTKI